MDIRKVIQNIQTPKVCLIILILFSFAFWGASTLKESSEARYGEVSREMLQSGDWIAPTLSGEEHLTKPPLTYWFIASGMRVFGVNAWGARLPLSLCFVITVCSIYNIAKNMGFSERKAIASCLIFATSVFSFVGSFILTTDPFLTCVIAISISCYWAYRNKGGRGAVFFFWIVSGIGFLVKGPPAWLHLIPLFLIHFIDRKNSQRPMYWFIGIPLMLGIGFSWYLLLVLRNSEILTYFIQDEVVNRVFTNTHNRENSPFQYLVILLVGIFPWVFLWKPAISKIMTFFKSKMNVSETPIWLRYNILWILIPLIVFMISKSRLPLYVLPLFIPLSLIMGYLLGQALESLNDYSDRKIKYCFVGISCWVLLLIGTRIVPERFITKDSSKRDGELIKGAYIQTGSERQMAWLFGHEHHGIPFYMDKTVLNYKLDSRDDLIAFNQSNKLSDWFFIIKSSKVEKLDDMTYQYQVICDTGDYSLVEIINTK